MSSQNNIKKSLFRLLENNNHSILRLNQKRQSSQNSNTLKDEKYFSSFNQSKQNILSQKPEQIQAIQDNKIGIRTNTSPLGKLSKNEGTAIRKNSNKIDIHERLSKQRSELKLKNLTNSSTLKLWSKQLNQTNISPSLSLSKSIDNEKIVINRTLEGQTYNTVSSTNNILQQTKSKSKLQEANANSPSLEKKNANNISGTSPINKSLSKMKNKLQLGNIEIANPLSKLYEKLKTQPSNNHNQYGKFSFNSQNSIKEYLQQTLSKKISQKSVTSQNSTQQISFHQNEKSLAQKKAIVKLLQNQSQHYSQENNNQQSKADQFLSLIHI
eukprot:TRINITY_DN12580_c0_g1_i1.p1 TRINITY_DN12580_c0_g1~~TRINITY_DN12580_c0_g1_i1.p1  ORF type:complete len:326 (+),score=55.93 TRINITY_DN12580_c0_g1_i1:213-1190(+)